VVPALAEREHDTSDTEQPPTSSCCRFFHNRQRTRDDLGQTTTNCPGDAAQSRDHAAAGIRPRASTGPPQRPWGTTSRTAAAARPACFSGSSTQPSID